MIHPDKAFYRPNETVCIEVGETFRATIWHLAEVVAELSGETTLQWTPPAITKRGYRVRIKTDSTIHWTAFDVLNQWTDAPRYGYLFDFSPERSHFDLSWLLTQHVNGLQFYDWLYRHEIPLPPQDEFADPLQRPLSLNTIKRLIEAAHQVGMAAMPYTAIYAATPAFAEAHPAWGLYDVDGQLIDFANGFLKIMNPESGWREHLVEQCAAIPQQLPFDGVHVDQYGEPRIGFNVEGQAVNLPQGFASTLRGLRDSLDDRHTLLFNLVHNFPLEAMIDAPVDFIYCELWEPQTTLGDLARVAKLNRKVSGNKPPVIAVYIKPEHEHTIQLAQAVIAASGAYHIAHGENALFLCDPYFPLAKPVSEEVANYLRRIADLQVAYGELLTFATPMWLAYEPQDLWCIAARWAGGIALNLINARPDMHWDQPHEALPVQENVSIQLEFSERVTSAWWVSPDVAAPPQPLSFTQDNHHLHLEIPMLQTWTLIGIHTETL